MASKTANNLIMTLKFANLAYILLAGFAAALLLVSVIVLRYPGVGPSRSAHFEAGLLAELLILGSAAFVGWSVSVQHKKDTGDATVGIIVGLICGAAWVLEISFNNFVDPSVATARARFFVDNGVWALISLAILVVSLLRSLRSGRLAPAVEVGLWSGLTSGLVSCLMALLLVAVWMPYLLRDPLNIAEYAARGSAEAPDMATYFAYETMFGALGHLVLLGIAFGLILGTLGGLLGYAMLLQRKKFQANRLQS